MFSVRAYLHPDDDYARDGCVIGVWVGPLRKIGLTRGHLSSNSSLEGALQGNTPTVSQLPIEEEYRKLQNWSRPTARRCRIANGRRPECTRDQLEVKGGRVRNELTVPPELNDGLR